MSSDRAVIESIRAEVGRDFMHEFEGEVCVKLALHDEEGHVWGGLIRHHSPETQQRILKLVARLRGLRFLDIHQNWLKQLPDEMGELKELRQLLISSNYLGTVPEWVWDLPKLEMLNLGVNNLTELSPRVGEMPFLTALSVHKNRIPTLPRELLQLKQLDIFSIYLNAIPEFPEMLLELPNIRVFSWGITQSETFPRGLGAWKKLEYLTVVAHRFDNAEGIEECESLLGMRLHKNRIKKLPKDMGRLKKLRQLTLYQNELSELPESMADMQAMRLLNIAWNKFERLPGCLAKMGKLQWLPVHHNAWANPAELKALPSHVEVIAEHPFCHDKTPIWNKLDYM